MIREDSTKARFRAPVPEFSVEIATWVFILSYPISPKIADLEFDLGRIFVRMSFSFVRVCR